MPVEDSRALLQEALLKMRALRAEVASLRRGRNEPVAIVGASCRLPGPANSPEAFWRMLSEGRDATREIPSGRWDVDAYYDPDPDVPGKMYVRRGGFLDDVASFDAEFFGISPREALRLDPQQRILLECAWEAFENAAIAPDSLSGSATGVFAGVMGADYSYRQAHHLKAEEVDPYMLAGGDLSFVAARVAYYLGLQGPAMSIATACSSSLVAIHQAAQALRAGECDLALAGGVSLILDPVVGIMLSKLRALSPDGRCKSFDAAADGYGRGEGCGVLVLERLSDAIAKRRHILAVIRGFSAVNHDGPSAGLTVPNGNAQEKLLRKAFEAAGVSPREIGYVETHGTGTMLGDPIEAQALARVMGERPEPLFIGSVKSAVGHLEAAAGVAGVMKTVLALQHGAIPPNLHFRTPNPHIPWDRIPLRVPVELSPWPGTERRIAGVSSFGLGGVNAHVVLEQAPELPVEAADHRPYMLALSAKTASALEQMRRDYRVFLEENPGVLWRDVCFTAQHGRAQLKHRFYLVADSCAEACSLLCGAAQQAGAPERQRLRELGERYVRDEEVEWPDAAGARCTTLPTYPFERKSYWVLDDAGPAAGGAPVHLETAANEDLPVLDALCHKASQVLGLSAPARPDDCLLDHGLDSLMAAELKDWLETERGLKAELAMLLSESSISGIASHLGAESRRGPLAPTPASSRRYPLSEGQKALWFIYQTDPGSTAYNVGVALRIPARVDTNSMKRAFEALLGRHASLRATFSVEHGEPLQQIQPDAELLFEQTEATGWTDEQLAARVSAAHRRPFNLTSGPLLRVSLFTRALNEHVLLISMHHIACDAISFWALLEEFQALYQGRDLPPKAATYEGYVEWQREFVAGAEGEKLWKFWSSRLSGELPILAPPADKPRPATLVFEGASCRLQVPAALTEKLRDLARSQGATLHQTLLAAYFALLHRYTNQEEIILGTATAGRPSQFAGVVGYFTNPVPVRADLSGNPEFVELLARVRRVTLEAVEHQLMPFALLVKRLQPARDPSRQPVFQADFALLRRPTAHFRRGEGLPLEPFELAAEEGQFDLSLHVTEDELELTAAFKFNTALFEAPAIEAMSACFLQLLQALTDNPRLRIEAAPLLPAPEQDRLLALGAGPLVNYSPSTVQQIFEAQAAKTPQAIAAEEFETGAAWTYAELNRRANAVASRLRSLGVGVDQLVGICLERSLDLAAAVLGTLKASAAYVPLDPGYPTERLAFMMRDAQMAAVLTSGSLADRLAVPEGVPEIILDADSERGGSGCDNNPPCLCGPGNFAYAIYTSGSTGVPKGALITHGGLTNYLNWCVKAYRVSEGCGAPVSSAFGFDATVTSFFAPLMVGGRIVLLPEDRTLESLAECLRRNKGFSLIKITPAHLEALSQLLAPEDCAGCANAFVIGGEALRGGMLEFWLKNAPGTRLINEYGPTEAVVGCCVYEVRDPLECGVPIGRPIANTQLYVLDGSMRPVPRGVVGELFIGGEGVARGYLNRPDVTQSKFVSDPFSQAPGARLFRTGDLARVLPDGNFEFLGRADDQVKLHGYRIELGEIESVLEQHPDVKAAKVVVHEERLAAYVTPAAAPPALELRRYLKERLPEYMLPAFFLALPELPLTPNGKLDRKALPSPEAARSTTHFVAPRDSLELKIAAIWEETLGVRPAGVKDNFFDMGGHSLLAVRLMTRMQVEFGKAVPLASILRGPTIERLASLVRNGAPASGSALVPIHASGSNPPFYCVPGAGGNVIYLYNLARHLGPDQPFVGLQAAGFDGEAPAHTSVEQMAAHYVAAIEASKSRGPYFLGGHSLGGWVAYEMAQILLRKGQEAPLVAVIDTPAPALNPPRDTSDWDNARWILELSHRIGQLLNPDLNVSIDEMRRLDTEAQFEYLKQALLHAGLFPGDAGSDHLRNILRLFPAHSSISYRFPRNPLPVKVALLRTAAPHSESPFSGDPSWGWSRVAETEVHMVPGEHLSCLRPPHVLTLAERLTACLDQARRAYRERDKGIAACP